MLNVLLIIVNCFSLLKKQSSHKISLFVHNTNYQFFKIVTKKGVRTSIVIPLCFFFLFTFKSYGQCAFGSMPFGATQDICYDSNKNTQITNVPLGNYVGIKVLEGVKYSISIYNDNSSFIKRITLYNSANTAIILATNDAPIGQKIVEISWTATFTGTLYVQYNDAANCSLTGSNLAIVNVNYTGGRNVVDTETAAGTNSWIGHVYDFAQTVGTLPATNEAFTTYLGSFSQPMTTSGTTNSFVQNFGGATVCFPFTGGGMPQTILTETFAVRYRMNTTSDVYPAGCYLVKINADDGVRLYVDGVLVFDAWIVQQVTTYQNVLIHLKANSELIFDYYENTDQNQCDFSITPFDSSTNFISTPSPIYRCNNVATDLNGSSFWYKEYETSNPTIKYQWQSSTDNFVTNSTDITGANSEDYTVPRTNPAVNTTLYYRRKMSESSTNTTSCVFYTNSVSITTSSAVPATPGAMTGDPTQCTNVSGQVYSIPAVANAAIYNWYVPSGWTITSGQGTTSITVTTGSIFPVYDSIKVTTKNGCGETNQSLGMSLNPVPAAPVATAPDNIQCSSVNLHWDQVPNAEKYYIDIATDSSFTNFVLDYNNREIGYYPLPPAGLYVGGLPNVTLYFRVRASNSCSVSANSNTVVFKTLAFGGNVSPNQAIYVGTQPSSNLTLTDVTYSVLKWQKSTDPAFATFNDIANTTPTLSVSEMGVLMVSTYFRAVVQNTYCGVVNSSPALITVNSIEPTATVTQPKCSVPTGTITVTSPTPASGTFFTVTGTNPVVAPVTNATGIFEGLTIGDYSVTYQMGTNPISKPLSVTILAPVIPTTTWIGTSWDNGDPNKDMNVVFASNYSGPITSEFEACSCQINSGVDIKVGVDGSPNDNAILIIVNKLDVQGTGTLTFENNASLVQVNDVVNKGNIIYKRNTSALKPFDYVYWSSPVLDQGLTTLASNTDLYYSWGGSAWNPESGAMTEGQGYIIRVNSEMSSQTATFTGVPNNGDIAFSAPPGSYCLIGNPYPSPISADAFITTNFNVTDTTGGTLYFWTHNIPRFPSGNQLVYSSNDYASYNLTGGTGIGTGSKSLEGVVYNNAPKGQIAAGQGFFTGINLSGIYNFTNAMRSSNSSDNSQFYRQSRTKKSTAIEKNRVWLNLTNDQGAFKQLLVGYVTGATNDYDNLYDGPSYNGNLYIDFYSINSAKNLTIQGRGLPFNTADEVPLGYKTTITGVFAIGIDDVDGSMVDQPIYLEDKLTGKIQNLKSGNYSFTTEVGTFEDRFVLRYTDTSTLGTEDLEANANGVLVSVKNRQIKVNSVDESIVSIKIYDLKGSLIYEKNKINKNEVIIDHLNSTNQLLIVKTQLESGKWASKKIIFH